MPPAWVDTTGFPPGELTGKIATPEYARAKKRWVLLQVEAEDRVSKRGETGSVSSDALFEDPQAQNASRSQSKWCCSGPLLNKSR